MQHIPHDSESRDDAAGPQAPIPWPLASHNISQRSIDVKHHVNPYSIVVHMNLAAGHISAWSLLRAALTIYCMSSYT